MGSTLGDITNVVECSSARPAFKTQLVPLEQQEPAREPAAPDGAVLEAAARAVLDASLATGMDSQWTSLLAARLAPLAWDGELQQLLRVHGWDGVQFTGPPDR